MAKTSGPITESNEKYKIVPIDSIRPHERNYNFHPGDQVDQLAASIHTFAQVKNIVVWRGQIIAGEGVWRGMQRDGQATVTVKDVSEWSEAKALAFMAVDNELARLAQPDMGKLAENLKAIAAVDVDLAALAAGGMNNFKFLTKLSSSPIDLELHEQWMILIECTGESQQSDLLSRFNTEGLKCRALIS